MPREVVDRILHETLSAPSARNTRTTRLVVVDDPVLVARMADMRDYGSAFMKGAPLAIVVLGDLRKATCGARTPRSRRPSCNWRVSTKGWHRAGCTSTAARAARMSPAGRLLPATCAVSCPSRRTANPYAPSRRGIPTSPPPRCPSRTTRRGSSAWDKADTGTEKKERLRHSCITNTKSRIFRSRVEAGVYRKICRRSLYRPSYASGQYPHADQETEDCASGLMLLQQEDPDVVLCDVELLDGNGVDMVERIKEWLRW